MTVTVAAAVVFADSPRVRVDVTSSPSVTDTVMVWRTHEDGSRYRVLTEAQATVVGTWTGFDYHAPFNQAVTYTAETDVTNLVSAPSAEVWVPSTSTTWLIHPSDPTLSVPVEKIMAVADYHYADRSQSYLVLGRKLPVHRTDSPRAGESGSMTIQCNSEQTRAAVKALFADGAQILINTQFSDDEIGWKWVQPGDVVFSNPAQKTFFRYREVTFAYTATTQPDADEVPLWTFDDVAATFATFNDVTARYTTLRDLQLDNRLP